jgi:ribonuclease J
MLAENGVVVDLSGGEAAIVGGIEIDNVYVDGLAVGDIGDQVIKQRQILGDEGFVSILVAVNLHAGKVVFGPELTARGFTDDAEALEPIRVELIQIIEKALVDGSRDADSLEHLVRRTVGRWVDKKYRRRPMLMPMVIEV